MGTQPRGERFPFHVTDLEVGQELLRPAVTLRLHDDVGQLVDDGVERPLRHQRPREVDLKSSACSVLPRFSLISPPQRSAALTSRALQRQAAIVGPELQVAVTRTTKVPGICK